MKRLLKGEACRPTGYGIIKNSYQISRGIKYVSFSIFNFNFFRRATALCSNRQQDSAAF
ncbi:MAG: hypothetical protein LBJ00_06710 [Planctomycetaceae bacterium]|nr:hypothetical protein [Planctomycetaceae bacterium]